MMGTTFMMHSFPDPMLDTEEGYVHATPTYSEILGPVSSMPIQEQARPGS